MVGILQLNGEWVEARQAGDGRTMQPEELHDTFSSRYMRLESVDSFSCLDYTFFRGAVVGLDDYNVFKLRNARKCGV